MKPDVWGHSFGKVVICFSLLGGVIATSAGAGLADEQNYTVATLGTSASPVSDTAHSAAYDKLRKIKTAAQKTCQVGSAIATCGDNEACCTKAGKPVCCTGGCNTAQCR
jgi:hypothetical protein